ncbi:PREDICTED: carbonic anhydrase 7-like [Nicrophorus vespilloides]|uniref:Carbonic anhydrase n=1 Tax=Nicrophorus vespilloides TaxID=110193 RepID=A0ABM1MBV4_NICVS|nr:PREDICTED: carbonic anhydrase 7-like [Nicrophorus vespilloides]
MILGLVWGEVCKDPDGKADKSAEFPAKEYEYDVRPNLFIGKEHLLGKSKSHGDKTPFTYSSGPYGPSRWPKLYPKCGGKQQSPINIDISSLKRINLSKLKWSPQFEKIPEKLAVTNNEHTVTVEVTFPKNEKGLLEGGPLTKPYKFSSIHFHWSSSDHRGSEHTIDKKSFPMEMHVIFYRSDLNATVAMKTDKGLVIIGYIFEIGDKCNDAIATLMEVSEQLKLEPDNSIDLQNVFRLDSLFDMIEKEYVTYIGSMTTPPCYETVIWIVSPYTLTLTKKQMEKFRSISGSSKGFGDNYRAIQALNGRAVNFVN